MSGDVGPVASIIVLGWNGRDYIDPCLRSLGDQDFERAYEILFIDNGSTDGTPDAAAKHEGVVVHRMDRNYGYCLGNNKGMEFARGRYIVFLNQDIVVHRSWLRELVAAIEDHPGVAAAHANIIQPWYAEFDAMERVAPVPAAYTADLSRFGFIHYSRVPADRPVVDTLYLHGVSIIVTRSLMDELVYAFDPDMFAYAEDMDLGLRVRDAGYRTVVATRAVVYHKHTLATSLSLRTFEKTVRIIRNRLLALWKSSTWPEFVPLAIVTLLGAPFNAGEFGLPPWKRVVYGVLLVPPTIAAVFTTAAAMPRYAERRRAVLASRRVGGWWLVRTMLFNRSKLGAMRGPAPEGG
jgi:GT2 family glycosyltransferase